MPMTPEVKMLLLGALIGFLATLLTAIASHIFQSARDDKDRKWKSAQEIENRWWDRKATAYGNIINTLVEMTNSLGNWVNLEFQSSEYNNTDLDFQPHIKTFRETLSKIEKAEIEGAYLISENTALKLNQLVRTLNIDDENESLESLERVDNYYKAAKDCLRIVRDEARKDLRVVN